MDVPLYDTTALCRECGTSYPTKSFFEPRADDVTPRYGLCPVHADAAEFHLAQLSKFRTEPKHKKPRDVDLHPPRRTWEPD